MTSESAHYDLLRVQNLQKSFGEQRVLDGVGFSVPRGHIFAVVGPSGAGKSILLKCLVGMIAADAGSIHFDGIRVTPSDPVAGADFRRRSSFLFQSNALFDSLSAVENVALPLEQTTRHKKSEIHERSMEKLKQLGLEKFANHFPGQLSGGMQKRLALARALVTQPEMVFFDEPTAGLDPMRRASVFAMIAQYQQEIGFTALVVTHDLAEALVVSNQVALLDGGHIRFSGTPEEFSSTDKSTVRDFRDSLAALTQSVKAIRRGEKIKRNSHEA